jgi:outer membrane protein assembly factor BamB
LSVATGSPYWRFETAGPLRGQPLIVEDKVYFGSFDGWFRALDLASGELTLAVQDGWLDLLPRRRHPGLGQLP